MAQRRLCQSSSASLALICLLLITLATLAMGFMLPMRKRLREPNDVHYTFRDENNKAGPFSLVQSTTPLQAATDGGAEEGPNMSSFLLDEKEMEETFMTFEEELFSKDKGAALDSILEQADFTVVEELQTFVPLKEMPRESKPMEESDDFVELSSMPLKKQVSLLKKVAVDLQTQVNQRFVRLQQQLFAYVSDILDQINKYVGTSAKNIQNLVGTKFDQIRLMAKELKTAGRGRYQDAKHASSQQYNMIKGIAIEKLQALCQRLEADARFVELKAKCGRFHSKSKISLQRTVMKGKSLVADLRAHQIRVWGGMKLQQQQDKMSRGDGPVRQVGNLVGAAVDEISSSSSSFSAMAYITGGATPPVTSVVPLNNDEPVSMKEADEAPVYSPSAVTKVDTVEEPLMGTRATEETKSNLEDSIVNIVQAENQEAKAKEGIIVDDEKGILEEKEEDDEDDDDHDGLGLTTPSGGDEPEEEYMEERHEASAIQGDELMSFRGVEITARERNAMLQLRDRLNALPPSQTAWVDDHDLIRYAREYFAHVDDAWNALKKTCEFREEQQVEALDLGAASPLAKELFWFGQDLEGDLVLVFRTALHLPGKYSAQEYLHFLLQLMEKGRREYGLGKQKQITLLVDRKDAGLRNQDPMLVAKIVPLLQAHFPGYLKTTFIAPATLVFEIIWRIFGLFLAPSTAQRVQLLKEDSFKGTLLRYFRPNQLMEHLGGSLQSYDDFVDNDNTTRGVGVKAILAA